VQFALQREDITRFGADVVAVKYAQAFYKADGAVASALAKARVSQVEFSPAPGDYRYVATHGTLAAANALFVGTPPLPAFSYPEIREFGMRVLSILAREAPETRHVAMTMHGVGFGLDEVECLLAQVGGCLEAINTGAIPAALEQVTILDLSARRVERLQRILRDKLSDLTYASQAAETQAYDVEVPDRRARPPAGPRGDTEIERAGTGATTQKPTAFVAMPFGSPDMEDLLFFIETATHAAGFLCERVDREAFTGDIMERVRQAIQEAAVVIGVLDDDNPNVYLEVGYAWGKDRPTILICKDGLQPFYDVRGHKRLEYRARKDLLDSLARELAGLKSKGIA
jgi:hypothetical protein